MDEEVEEKVWITGLDNPDDHDKAKDIAGRVFGGQVSDAGVGWRVHQYWARFLHHFGLHDEIPVIDFDLETGRVSPPVMACWICSERP